MALKKTRRITKEDIITHVGEENIFSRYWRNFEVGKVYNSPFRKDSKPSAGIYVNKDGNLIFNDFGSSSEKLGAISFVMKIFNLTYTDAIKKIAGDFNLTEEKLDCEPIKKVGFIKKKRDKLFDVTVRKFTEADLEYWSQYEITKKELLDNKVYSVKSLYINGVPIPYKEDEIRFVYVVKGKDQEYYKILAPNSEIKWQSNCPIAIPFGITELPQKSDTCFILKAQKCRITALKFFTDCTGLQAENRAALTEKLLNWLKKRYKRIVYFGDNDVPGLEMIEHFRSLGVECHHFPEFYLSDWGVKDLSDFVKVFSVKELEVWLKGQNLL